MKSQDQPSPALPTGTTAAGLGVLLGILRKPQWVGGLLAAAGAAGIAASIGWLK